MSISVDNIVTQANCFVVNTEQAICCVGRAPNNIIIGPTGCNVDTCNIDVFALKRDAGGCCWGGNRSSRWINNTAIQRNKPAGQLSGACCAVQSFTDSSAVREHVRGFL